MKYKHYMLLSILLSVLLAGCGLFTSHYDETRHENFTRLKALHVKLFDDWTDGSGREWNKEQVSAYCNTGDLRFREAFEYAKSGDKADKTGQKAVRILWDEFSDNCSMLIKKQKLFSSVFKENILPVIEKNYEFAIAGELARVNKSE